MIAPPPSLACPVCKKPLEIQETLRCAVCQRSFPIHEEIPCFISKGNAIHEEIYQGDLGQEWIRASGTSRLLQGWGLGRLLHALRQQISIDFTRERFLKKHLRRLHNPALILDLACGAGRPYFTRFGAVVGCDVVRQPLQRARELYACVVQADANALPFGAGTFDAVIATDALGHIPVEEKDGVVKEIWRVLKPGGITVQVIETEGDNALMRFAHRYPELYKKHFVDKPGHHGLEPSRDVAERFERAGFQPISSKKIWGPIWPIQAYASQFENEYQEHSKTLRWLVSLSRALSHSPILREFTNILLNPVSIALEAMTPLEHGTGLLVCLRKT